MNVDDNIAISLFGISKKYVINNKSSDLRGTLGNLFTSKKEETYWALRDLSFNINKGETVGIIGKNGAGKSTLLKILSKITLPTKGEAIINGKVASLLEVGTGFHPELTGRENIYLNGSILGMNKSEIIAEEKNIIGFSGVEKFIDTPVKHYSSGMYVRLAFAVAAHLRSDILLIDEVLSVGDFEFQQKCLGFLENNSIADQKTVVIISHNLNQIRNLCERCIVLAGGKITYDGLPSDAISHYLNKSVNPPQNSEEIYIDLKIEGVKNEGNILRTIVGSNISFHFEFTNQINIIKSIKVIFLDENREELTLANTYFFLDNPTESGKKNLSLIIPKLPLNVGKYYIYAEIISSKNIVIESFEKTLYVSQGAFYPRMKLPPSSRITFLLDHMWKKY